MPIREEGQDAREASRPISPFLATSDTAVSLNFRPAKFEIVVPDAGSRRAHQVLWAA
jgi:hypothetical protein